MKINKMSKSFYFISFYYEMMKVIEVAGQE